MRHAGVADQVAGGLHALVAGVGGEVLVHPEDGDVPALRLGSTLLSAVGTSSAVNPPCRRSSPTEPYMGSAIDCVAMTPWPGSAKGTLLPTANACDCVATPISPVAASRATIE